MAPTPKQIAAVHAIKRAKGWDDEQYRAVLQYYNIESSKDMTRAQVADFINAFGARPAAENSASKMTGHKYTGHGGGSPNSNLTQGQAEAIGKLEMKLGWDKYRTRYWIQKALHKSCAVEMLMQFEARKLIHVMSRILTTGKKEEHGKNKS